MDFGDYRDQVVFIACIGIELPFNKARKVGTDMWSASKALPNYQDVSFSCLLCTERHMITWPAPRPGS
jgi:hypothetical protein